jgi:transcriptional regulator with XRE-family HTH domain
MLTTVHDLWFLLLTDRERTMTLATRIAELRRQKNESLQDVATAAGVTKTHIWELERGRTKNPSLQVIEGLANHFGVSIAYLVGEDIEAADADQNLARMFRLAGELDEHERRVIDDMIGVFRRRRLERDGHRT